MRRVRQVRGGLLLASVVVAAGAAMPQRAGRAPEFTVVEATIPDMQQAMREGRVTSRDLVTEYLTRIARHDKRINAAISVNPRALDDADARDAERAAGRVRGPLHGIPIALKDNIHTVDVPTTGGALAFADFLPPYDATLTANLREAGAVIIAKTVLTELANWVAGAPTPMPGNYTAVAGFAFNPYDPRPDPRENTNDGRPVMSTGGSSSGAGTAASFWAANVGTDTAGSIVNPAMLTMIVGLRPTTGLISRHGIIPITADQDTAGPMARTVTDMAILLGALVGAAPDPRDAATSRCQVPGRDYTAFLKVDALKGARIGIPRAYYFDRLPGTTGAAGAAEATGAGGRGGLNTAQAALMADAIEVLKRAGAVIVDPANLPTLVDPDPAKNILSYDICSGANNGKGRDANCSVVLKYGMKRDFNAYLSTLGPAAPVKSLTELREFNRAHARANAIRYGQSNLDISDEMDVEGDRARYEADRARDVALAGDHGFKAAVEAHRLDALLFPGWNVSNLAARPGFPEIVVPIGVTPPANVAAFPPGFDPRPSPYSAAFVGLPCSEPRLIEIAYAFEQATRRRVPPPALR